MEYNIKVTETEITVSLCGSIYIEEAGLLKENLIQYIEKGYKRFVIDLADVDYIDSSGLGVLVALQKRALQNGGGVAIKGIKGIVKDLFNLTQLVKVFEVIY